MISIEKLRHHYSYDPETGAFTRLITFKGGKPSGIVQGHIDTQGYLRIGIKGKSYKAHRLAWFFVHGVWPSGQIDHIDRNKLNNRISNLRDVTQSYNQHNRVEARRDNVAGLLGVRFNKKDGKYHARITANRKHLFLGQFDDPQEASAAYFAAKEELHPGFLR